MMYDPSNPLHYSSASPVNQSRSHAITTNGSALNQKLDDYSSRYVRVVKPAGNGNSQGTASTISIPTNEQHMKTGYLTTRSINSDHQMSEYKINRTFIIIKIK